MCARSKLVKSDIQETVFIPKGFAKTTARAKEVNLIKKAYIFHFCEVVRQNNGKCTLLIVARSLMVLFKIT